MTDQEQKAYDIAFGLHSRIPSCCIRFYLDEWEYVWRSDCNELYKLALNYANVQYVMCPQCLGTGNKVKLKICANECGGDHREDFIPKKEATDGYRSDTHKQLHLSDRV